MSAVLAQGDKRWGNVRVGAAKTGARMAAVGCLVTCYAQALRDLRVDDDATPVTVNDAGDFRGAAMVQPTTAEAIGLVADDVTHASAVHRNMRKVLVDALTSGAVVVMHVDHDSTKADGDPDGDHFVLGRYVDGDVAVFADPATGEEGRMDLRMLACVVMWGASTKRYELRSVRPLRRAA